MSYTKGPWIEHQDGIDVYAEDGQMKICDIRGWGYLTGSGSLNLPEEKAVEIQIANAKLIAAAPDLLEVLSTIVANAELQSDARMDYTTDIYAVPLDDINAAKTAIEKATK